MRTDGCCVGSLNFLAIDRTALINHGVENKAVRIFINVAEETVRARWVGILEVEAVEDGGDAATACFPPWRKKGSSFQPADCACHGQFWFLLLLSHSAGGSFGMIAKCTILSEALSLCSA